MKISPKAPLSVCLLAICVPGAIAAGEAASTPADDGHGLEPALLVGLGGYRLVRARHLVYGGMRANGRQLATWSFLMASAHGAGLMVLPLVLGHPAGSPGGHALAAAALGPGTLGRTGLLAALIHSAGYLAVTGAIAALVYERFGVGFLRRGWINLDLLWAIALVATGVATFVL
jgi:hypothetical protein